MSDDESSAHAEDSDLRLLREELSNLVKTVPGPVASVSLRRGDCAVEVTWSQLPLSPGLLPQQPVEVATTQTEQVTVLQEARSVRTVLQAPAERTFHEVTAPLVGTFYTGPEPGAAPYITPGARVEAGNVVGIVEAMKLMNPVHADRTGLVVEVVVHDGEPVEFGQVLVRLEPDES